MQRGRAAGEGSGVGDADPIGKFPLERVDMGSERSDPVRVEGIKEEFALLRTGVGR